MAKEKKKAPALPEGDEVTPQKKSSKKKIIIILIVLLLLLSGAGAGAYWWFFIRNPGSLPFDIGAKVEDVQKGDAPAEEAAKGKGKDQEKQANADSARIERPAGLPRSGGVVLPLSPITVNLYDAGGHRYLKLGMEVEANKDISGQLKANEPRIRDAVIMLLAGKTYNEVASPDGKVMLKAEVANRLNQILGEQRIIRVYFTDFVVQ